MAFDITERLDLLVESKQFDLADLVCADAKAEIERLRKRCRTLENTAKVNLAGYNNLKASSP